MPGTKRRHVHCVRDGFETQGGAVPILAPTRLDVPVGWGIVSTGHIAGRFADDLTLLDDAHAVAVCSRDRRRAESFAAARSGATRAGKLRSVRPYGSLEAMLEDPAVEVVYVASVNTAHREAVVAALEAGKAVLCEKPMATSAHEAREMYECAARERGFLSEAMWVRHLPAVRAAVRKVEAGEIGEVVAIRGDLTVRRPFDATSRLFDPAVGGGALLDLGIYPISLAIAFGGPPSSVAGRWWRNPAGTDSRATIEMACRPHDRHEGVDVRLACGFGDTDNANRFVVQGTKGALILDSTLRPKALSLREPFPEMPPAARPRTFWSRFNRWTGRVFESGRVERHGFRGSGLRFQAARVGECLRDGVFECPETPVIDSIRALEVIDAVRATDPVGEA